MAFSLARTLPLLAVSRGSRRKGKSGNSGKHQVLSPFARGLLLVPVFILWIGLSGWFETSKLSVGPEFQSRSKYSNRNKAENDTMRTNLLNWCNLVSISKNVVFYVFLVVRIY